MSGIPLNELILASGSSRRRHLLEKLNIRYSIYISEIDESLKEGETATDYVDRIALSKARAAITLLEDNNIVLAADTIISVDNEVIGKPENFQHAINILKKLSAREHDVITGVCLLNAKTECQIKVLTKVKFKLLSDREIHTYCLTDEPYDKAGAYAIQGEAASFVEYISGSYTNVMGLPLVETYQQLKQLSI